MATDAEAVLGMVRTFLDRVHFATPGQVPAVVRSAAEMLGWHTTLYLADYEQRVLVPAQLGDEADATPHTIDGTLAGRCFRTVDPMTSSIDPTELWLPVVDGVERLGVLQVRTRPGTDRTEPRFLEACRLLGHMTGHLIAAKRPYGDALDRVMRTRRRSVASELLHELLPPLTFACEGLVVAGFLQPTYDVAADAFDYSVVDGAAHLAIFDATGHDLEATSLAAVALSAYRNARRGGDDLLARAAVIDDLVSNHGTEWRFATGVLMELDVSSGRVRYLNAGHPYPLLMRRGKVVKELTGGHRTMFGLPPAEAVDAADEWLEPGDRIVLYTDGITEARDREGNFFGLEALVDHLERAAATGQPAPETLRRISHTVFDHQEGQLQDDATLLLAEWATGEEFGLTSTTDADVAPHELTPDDPPG
jgi:serine phosphatase RsbU (regulator of sigma subunit)